MKSEIEERLKKIMAVEYLKITDDSAKHHGHPESKKSGGGHFHLFIVSNEFEGLTPLQRHRLINKALKDKFSKGIHALQIKALTPKEHAGH